MTGQVEDDGSVKGDIKKQYLVEMDAEGYPIANHETQGAFASNQVQSVRLIIAPQCQLKFVPRVTESFVDFQRLEFWTQYGIFIVGAPAYGWRRLPSFGENVRYANINIQVSGAGYQMQIGKREDQEESQKNVPDMDACIKEIFDEFGFPVTGGSKNVYFTFPDTTKWGEVEMLMAKMFRRIDSLRGFWIGKSKEEGKVTIHFHDVYTYR